jgi:hypothetical protein
MHPQFREYSLHEGPHIRSARRVLVKAAIRADTMTEGDVKIEMFQVSGFAFRVHESGAKVSHFTMSRAET